MATKKTTQQDTPAYLAALEEAKEKRQRALQHAALYGYGPPPIDAAQLFTLKAHIQRAFVGDARLVAVSATDGADLPRLREMEADFIAMCEKFTANPEDRHAVMPYVPFFDPDASYFGAYPLRTGDRRVLRAALLADKARWYWVRMVQSRVTELWPMAEGYRRQERCPGDQSQGVATLAMLRAWAKARVAYDARERFNALAVHNASELEELLNVSGGSVVGGSGPFGPPASVMAVQLTGREDSAKLAAQLVASARAKAAELREAAQKQLKQADMLGAVAAAAEHQPGAVTAWHKELVAFHRCTVTEETLGGSTNMALVLGAKDTKDTTPVFAGEGI